MQYCPKCGWVNKEPPRPADFTELVVSATVLVYCIRCGRTLKWSKEYTIPIFNLQTKEIEKHTATIAQELLKITEMYAPVPDGDDSFNIKVNGEWNNVPIGKKIQEKNEKLKRMHAGYSHEQKALRENIENQVVERKKQEGIN